MFEAAPTGEIKTLELPEFSFADFDFKPASKSCFEGYPRRVDSLPAEPGPYQRFIAAKPITVKHQGLELDVYAKRRQRLTTSGDISTDDWEYEVVLGNQNLIKLMVMKKIDSEGQAIINCSVEKNPVYAANKTFKGLGHDFMIKLFQYFEDLGQNQAFSHRVVHDPFLGLTPAKWDKVFEPILESFHYTKEKRGVWSKSFDPAETKKEEQAAWSLGQGQRRCDQKHNMTDEISKLVREIEQIKRVTPVQSYKDLEVYQVSYKASIILIKAILFKLPANEKFDSVDQLQRSSKAIPRLIAEGYAKKHQQRGFQKYLDDAFAESNETEVGVSQIIDIYSNFIDPDLARWLLDLYAHIGKQICKLKFTWKNFSSQDHK